MATKRRSRAALSSWPETTVPATEFKAKCLKLMEAVKQRRMVVVITKRGKPVAKLVPATAEAASPVGFLRGGLVGCEDLVSADPESWAAAPDPLDRRS
jgi:prevent-host-death family protein